MRILTNTIYLNDSGVMATHLMSLVQTMNKSSHTYEYVMCQLCIDDLQSINTTHYKQPFRTHVTYPSYHINE